MKTNTINETANPNVVLVLIVGIGLALSLELLSPFKVPFLAYSIILVVIILFYRYPYHALLVSFLAKPVIDMFWLTKVQGFISPGLLSKLTSPLFVVAIAVPVLALLRRKSVTGKPIRSRCDWAVLVYLSIFGMLTLFKIIQSPNYLYNSVDSYARIFSVTSFYFIGKYYFQQKEQRKELTWIIILSSLVPFTLTLFQKVLGRNLTSFADVVHTGELSAFYIGGRHGLVRISGVYEGVYELAFFSAFTVLLLVTIMLSKKRFPAWGYIMLPLGGFFLYFTYSRSAWALFLFSLILFSICKKKISYLAIILLGVTVLYVTIPNVTYRYEDELGFVLGKKEFASFGYGRGGLWIRLVEGFMHQDIFPKLIGNYGLGNPENQFLGIMFWFGYIGLTTFVLLIIYLTGVLWKKRRDIENNSSFDANIKFMFLGIIIGGYWIAGLGNAFNMQITVQWVLWTWTGILLSDNTERIEPKETVAQIFS